MRTNLIPNPSFEVDTSGWLPTAATLSRSLASQFPWPLGSAALQFTSDGSSPYASAIQLAADGVPVVPGQWVTYRAWVCSEQASTGVLARLQIIFSGTATTYSSGAWESAPFYTGKMVTLSALVPATATSVRVQAQIFSGDVAVNLTSARRGWLDQVIVAVGATRAETESAVTPYFDGSFPWTDLLEFGWEGTPHASASFEREWGPAMLSDGVASIAVPLLTDEHESPSRNRVHALLGDAAPDVTLRPMGARTGTLECYCPTRLDALALLNMHRPGGPFTLTGGGPDMGMRYTLAEGQGPRLRREMPFRRWVVTIPYQEVAT